METNFIGIDFEGKDLLKVDIIAGLSQLQVLEEN